MLGQYLNHLKQESPLVEGSFQIVDPHHGTVALFWKGKHIWGVLGVVDPGLRAAYLTYFAGLTLR